MSRTPSANRNGFIQWLAAAWIQEIGLHGFVGHPGELFEHPEVVKRVNRLRPATLGVLAWHGIAEADTGCEGKAEGRTSLYSVHCGTYLGKRDGGKECLRRLAQTAIAAEMFDQLGRPYADWREQSPAPEIKIPISTETELYEAGHLRDKIQ